MQIVDRFLGYTAINTTTNREAGAAGVMPSSTGQRVLADKVAEELIALGLTVEVADNAILTATLPANVAGDLPTVAFFAHLDTSAEHTNDTHAQVVAYEGGISASMPSSRSPCARASSRSWPTTLAITSS